MNLGYITEHLIQFKTLRTQHCSFENLPDWRKNILHYRIVVQLFCYYFV